MIYDVDPSLTTDDDLTELPPANTELALDEDDDLDLSVLDELPEDPEAEPEDEFAEGSPRFEQFKSDFNKAFGLPMEEARELVQSLKADSVKRQINEQKYELSAAWDVPVTVVDERLAIVANMWKKLPADKQQAYDSTKGAQALYAAYEQQQQRKLTAKGAAKGTAKSGLAVGNTSSKYLYSEKQINAMDAQTYAREAQNIMVAYAQGRVKR